ncbi:hypothetical protein M1N90_00820 [Dehalococcoidia bacterium]|nr:hypothetical protein [Dehalococcoidia bacterium]
MLLRASIPTEAGNAGLKDGSMMEKLGSILEDAKPEAVYFFIENGKRTCLMIFDMNEQSQFPAIVEPWFLSMGADITVVPVMNGEDFEKAGPSIGATIQKYL